MTCPVCRRGDDVEHGRMLCRWRCYRSAHLVRVVLELERQNWAPEPGSDRLRLAWWVVRRATHEWGWQAHEHALLARNSARRLRALSKGLDYYTGPCGARATRDIGRYAANRWALAALEAIEAAPCT